MSEQMTVPQSRMIGGIWIPLLYDRIKSQRTKLRSAKSVRRLRLAESTGYGFQLLIGQFRIDRLRRNRQDGRPTVIFERHERDSLGNTNAVLGQDGSRLFQHASSQISVFVGLRDEFSPQFSDVLFSLCHLSPQSDQEI